MTSVWTAYSIVNTIVGSCRAAECIPGIVAKYVKYGNWKLEDYYGKS